MSGTSDRTRETSREEDYRDYDERDLDDGWPYPDGDTAKKKRNEAYGAAPAGLEGDANPGAEIAANPEIRSGGGPALAQGIAREAIDDDALEEQIFDQLSNRDDIDEDQITVTVRDGIAELTGRVDRADATFIAEQIAGAVPGVRFVRNRLVSMGIDSHIPSDATD
jgi:osmotically-inducible protein OsmY